MKWNERILKVRIDTYGGYVLSTGTSWKACELLGKEVERATSDYTWFTLSLDDWKVWVVEVVKGTIWAHNEETGCRYRILKKEGVWCFYEEDSQVSCDFSLARCFYETLGFSWV